MFSRSTKGKGKEKEGKSAGGPSHSSAGPSRSAQTSTKPTHSELEYAAGVIAWALETIGVRKFGFIGGAAVAIFATQYGLRPRQTDDLDLIVQPSSMSADHVSRILTTNPAVKDHFVSKREDYVDKPHVIVPRADSTTILISIEIFDWEVWPQRQQYYNLDYVANIPQYFTLGDRTAPLLNPGWLLRQKILAFAQRQKKGNSDMADIDALRKILDVRGETITIIDHGEVEALKVLLKAPEAPKLKGLVLCEAIWPTEWTWDTKQKSLYRYDESWKKVWGKPAK